MWVRCIHAHVEYRPYDAVASASKDRKASALTAKDEVFRHMGVRIGAVSTGVAVVLVMAYAVFSIVKADPWYSPYVFIPFEGIGFR